MSSNRIHGRPRDLLRGTNDDRYRRFHFDARSHASRSGVYVQSATGAGTFKASGVNIPVGAASFSASVTGDTPLASIQTQFFAPLNFNWSIGQAGTSCTNATYGCVTAGSSANPVYATLAPNVLPSWAGPIMLTYVKLAIGNGGAVNQATALGNTWAQFSTGSGPANVVTWDSRSMQYYTAGIRFLCGFRTTDC